MANRPSNEKWRETALAALSNYEVEEKYSSGAMLANTQVRTRRCFVGIICSQSPCLGMFRFFQTEVSRYSQIVIVESLEV